MAKRRRSEHRRLGSVEQYARSAHATPIGPAILKTVQLPSFHDTRVMLWPRKQTSLAAAYAQTAVPPPPSPHAFTSDWWKDGAARSERVRREFQHVENYYSKVHADTEERQKPRNQTAHR